MVALWAGSPVSPVSTLVCSHEVAIVLFNPEYFVVRGLRTGRSYGGKNIDTEKRKQVADKVREVAKIQSRP